MRLTLTHLSLFFANSKRPRSPQVQATTKKALCPQNTWPNTCQVHVSYKTTLTSPRHHDERDAKLARPMESIVTNICIKGVPTLSALLCCPLSAPPLSLTHLFIYLFIMSYLPRSTPSVRSTVLPGAPASHA